ncbi:MAG: hypothetical protein Kow0059_10090 [Candidatus Sumerlaeia bacterium]
MSDDRALLLALINQFYQDLERLAEHDASLILEDTSIVLFNALLAAAAQAFPDHVYLAAFHPWEPRSVKAKDALICVGQLRALLSHETGR